MGKRAPIRPGAGLPCPGCGAVDSGVTDTRAVTVGGVPAVRRRRECKACGVGWATLEVHEDSQRALLGSATGPQLSRALVLVGRIKRAMDAYELEVRSGKPG